MNHSACGFDFGTSNSTLGVCPTGKPFLVPLEGKSSTIKSAIFFDSELGEMFFGQQGIDEYFLGAKGRLMMSLKTILGSGLINEKTAVCGKWVTYQEILGFIVKHIKQHAENYLQQELTQVVLGRPVHYNDHDLIKDRNAQAVMEAIVRAQGFKDIVFQYEPVAAAKDHEQSITREELACIIDLGGGTSDFTIIRLNKPQPNVINRQQDILANHGIYIGGNNFDRELSLYSLMPALGKGSLMQGSSNIITIPSGIFYELTHWHSLNFVYSNNNIQAVRQLMGPALSKDLIKRLLNVLENKLGHHLLTASENAKITLSSERIGHADLSVIDEELIITIKRETFESSVQKLINNLQSALNETLRLANIPNEAIVTVFLTGGTTQIPLVKQMIQNFFPNSQLILGDIYGSVGKGLAIESQEIFT